MGLGIGPHLPIAARLYLIIRLDYTFLCVKADIFCLESKIAVYGSDCLMMVAQHTKSDRLKSQQDMGLRLFSKNHRPPPRMRPPTTQPFKTAPPWHATDRSFCQAPSFWSSHYESFGVHNTTWFRVSCREVVGGAERSEAETTASRLAANRLGVM